MAEEVVEVRRRAAPASGHGEGGVDAGVEAMGASGDGGEAAASRSLPRSRWDRGVGERGSGEVEVVGGEWGGGWSGEGDGWWAGLGRPVSWPGGREACWAGWSSVVGGFVSFFFFIYLFFFWFYLILFYKL